MNKKTIIQFKIFRINKRTTSGVYIVEVLVSLIIGSLLAFTLGNSLSEAFRISSTSQNETYANAVVENLLECSRSIKFAQLAAYNGQEIEILNANEPQTSLNVHVDPLLIDLTRKWEKIDSSKFRGSIVYSVTDGPEPGDSLKVTATAKWSDSSTNVRQVSHSIIKLNIDD